MVDPISLGLIAATIFATKVIEKLGERTGDEIADTVGPIKQCIEDVLGADESDALAQVERAPDSRIAIDALARRISDAAARNTSAAERLEQELRNSGAIDSGDGTTNFQANLSDLASVRNLLQARGDITFHEK